jgi:hypothetical protein
MNEAMDFFHRGLINVPYKDVGLSKLSDTVSVLTIGMSLVAMLWITVLGVIVIESNVALSVARSNLRYTDS